MAFEQSNISPDLNVCPIKFSLRRYLSGSSKLQLRVFCDTWHSANTFALLFCPVDQFSIMCGTYLYIIYIYQIGNAYMYGIRLWVYAFNNIVYRNCLLYGYISMRYFRIYMVSHTSCSEQFQQRPMICAYNSFSFLFLRWYRLIEQILACYKFMKRMAGCFSFMFSFVVTTKSSPISEENKNMLDEGGSVI